MIVETFNHENLSGSYKIVISTHDSKWDRPVHDNRIYYRFTIYFGAKTIFSQSYIKSLEDCREQAKKYCEVLW